MVETLHSRFSCAEDYFLSSIARGLSDITEFFSFWASLEADFTKAMGAKILDDDTVDLAQRVVSRIEALASDFMSLTEQSEDLVSSLAQEVQILFSSLAVSDVATLVVDDQDSRNSASLLPPYIDAAYTWLLTNLHNPYPSKRVKSSIACGAGCPIKQVDSWFTNIRRRVGWNQLRAKHFSNRRSLIVAAATRFFVHNLGDDHSVDFITIKNNVALLYDGKLRRSLSPDSMVCSSRTSSRRIPQKSPYPSPECSPEPAFKTSPVHSSSHKKRRCPIEESEGPDSGEQSSKRPRLELPQISEESAVASLPSPAPSSQDVSETSSVEHPVESIPLSGKRKRCLSDGDRQSPMPSKRRYVGPAAPLLRTVSTPSFLPFIEDASLDALSFNMDIPPSVTEVPINEAALGSYEVSCDPDGVFANIVPSELVPSFEGLYVPSLDPYHIADSMYTTYTNISRADTVPDSRSLNAQESKTGSMSVPFMTPHRQESVIHGLEAPFPFDADVDWSNLCGVLDIMKPIFGEYNCVDPHPNVNTLDAKRKRAQILRDELRRLEVDIHS